MSYVTARECFEENLTLIGGAQDDPVAYNLYTGLLNLTESVERDLDRMHRALADLASVVQNLR